VSFDYLGTFNRSQFERYIAFARSQVTLVDARIQHLEAEIARVGSIVFRYNKGVPIGYSADPAESYLGKLLGAYEVLGGDPFVDLRVRLWNDPVYLVRGTETNPAQYMSNGEVIGQSGLSDAPTAELMRQSRTWLDATLHGRFGALERKIRRAVDYSDQLRLEIANLEVIKLTATATGSLEYIATQINQYFSDKNYRAIFEDNGSDKFGFTVYAPFSSYDVGPSTTPGINRVATSPQRQNDGFVGPGETGGA